MARARFPMDRYGSVDLEHSTGNVLMMTRTAALEEFFRYGYTAVLNFGGYEDFAAEAGIETSPLELTASPDDDASSMITAGEQ